MQHKSTAERRYRMELAAVIGVGLLIAVAAVVAILTVNRSPVEETDNFNTQSVTFAGVGHTNA